MSRHEQTLLILGASARAAAFSARRAGWEVSCGDMFADVDLREMGRVELVRDFPAGLEEVANRAPSGPWMYTGALENHPRRVERIAARRPLLGNGAEVLRRIRDPFLLTRALQAAGLTMAECRTSSEGLPCDGTWLRKRKKSAGGLHVQVWSGPNSGFEEAEKKDAAGWYFQRRIEGLCCSAAYIGAKGNARLLGATEQLVGPQFGQREDLVPSAFCYAGSIGPLQLSHSERNKLQRIGEVLSAEFQLRGLFGVDLIRHDQDFYPVEVNPRYTASMEVLEWNLGMSLVGWHLEACRNGELPKESELRIRQQSLSSQTWHGKAIVYAESSSHVASEVTARLMAENDSHAWPVVADIPSAGTSLEPGQPVATVFAEGSSRDDVVERLGERVRWCRAVLGG